MTNNVNVSGGSSGSINVNATSSTTNASATSASGSSNVETVNNAAWFWANLAKEWAIKMSGLVQGEDYSSKYWAQESKGYAEQAEEIIQSKDEILAELEQEGNTQIGLIEDAGTEQIGLVESSTDAQIERIEDAGDTQITNITNVSNTNIATINGLIGDAQSAASAAANSAQSASDSATSASNSSTSASNSANSAQTSATEAASSASSASDSATAAATSAQSAAGSATSASNSATAASGSASSAQSSATSASNSASSASSSATSASNSATSAASSASAAATSEDNAEIWAEGTDEEVQALGGIHSAKGWADVSSAGQIQADWEEEDTTSKAYIRNKPSNFASSISDLTDVDLTGLSNGDVLVYDSTSQEWKAEAQSGGVDLTAGTDLEIVSIGSQGLPNGYTLLEWVESNGLQSLSLGFSGNCTIEFTVQMAHVPTSNEVLLTSSTGASAGTWFGVNSDNTWSYSEISGLTKIDVVMNATAQGLNGTINGNAFNRNVPVTHGTWTLFNNIPTSGAATFPSFMKLFTLKVTQNSAVIRNLIPCKNTNNVVGLYDTINSVFYSSTSGTQLIAGTVIPTGKVINFTNESGYTKNVGTVTSVNGVQPDSNGNVTLVTGGVTDVEVNGESVVTDSVAEIDLTGYQKKLTAGTDLEIVEGSILPAGYVQLTSITSTGTQWINTGVKLTNNFKSIIVGRLAGTQINNFRTILGAVDGNLSTGKQNVLIGWGTSSNGFYTEVCKSQPTYIYSSYPWDTNTHTFTTSVTSTTTTLNIDGVINTLNNATPSITGVNLAIFARLAQNNTASSQSKFELNSIELYQSGVLVFNGVPAKRNADGEIGLYETVSNTFLTNSGTGTFSAGAEVPADTVINFTNDTGYIIGINSTDVTTALGYTPYNATNPNGYTSNVGTVTSVNNELPDANGNVTIQSGSSRNIGEIVASTIPLTDAGLHLLDGALISGSGSYSAFVDYIAGLVADYPDLFDTEANWQSAVTQYGVCGKFVYTQPTYQLIDTASSTTGWFTHSLEVGSQIYATNGTPQITIASISGNHITVTGAQAALFPNGFDRDTANDVGASVRLPKITGFIEGTTDLTALGDLVEAGLPNITGSFGIRKSGTSSNTIFDKRNALNGTATTTDVSTPISTSGTAVASQPIGFDASLSNPIYGNSSTVQPQTIKVLYYIVVATSTKTNIEVDIDEIATDLNGKADVDGSNMVNSVKNFDSGWVNSYLQLGSTVISTSQDQTYSLASYLPNDGYNYEVLVGAHTTVSTDGKFCNIYAHTDLITGSVGIAGGSKSGTNYTFYSCGSTILPVGTGRTITIIKGSSKNANGVYTLNAFGYRRIGTNQ